MKKAIQWTRGERIALVSVLGGVFALTLLTLWFAVQDESGPPELKPGSDLSLLLSKLKPGKLFLFRYHIDPSVTTPIAVQKGSDGIVRAALASCPACPKSENYQWSGRLICGHCQHVMRMPAPTMKPGARSQGCSLPSLAYSVAGDQFILRGETITTEYRRQFERKNAGEAGR